MAITLPSGFKITAAEAVDSRLLLTKQQMRETIDSKMPEKYLTICNDDGELYLYNKSNTASELTGKFVKFAGGKTYTAGTNIQISDDNVISATDTTYTAGTGIDITNSVISLDPDASVAIYNVRSTDANLWLTNGYTKTSAEIPTANLPSVCTGNDRWGVLLYIAENNENHAGLQQYFPIDGTYKGRIFYRSVTGYSASVDPEFGEWELVPWSSEKQDTLTAGANVQISADNVISATDTVYDDTAVKADIATLQSGKLNKLPNVDDPEDPGYGYPYWIPYNFSSNADANKVDITLKTLTLDNNLLKHEFTNTFPPATTTTAGTMSAADKVKVDSIDTKTAVDDTTITRDSDSKLTITGFNEADSSTNNKMPVKNTDGNLEWQNAASTAQLDAAVLAARNSAVNAAVSEVNAQTYYEGMQGKFWFGTMEEYNAIPASEFREDGIYIIKDGFYDQSDVVKQAVN